MPPERVIGSALGLTYAGANGETSLVYKAAMEFFDDGPEKPIRIWSRIGRRPILSGGQLQRRPPDAGLLGLSPDALRCACCCCHDDAEREFDYVAGAEDALVAAEKGRWTVVSMKNDWTVVFGPTSE